MSRISPTETRSKLCRPGGDIRNRFQTGVRAVAATLMVIVVVPDVFKVVLGMEQVTSNSSLGTEQVNDTGPAKLFCGVSVMVAVAELPAGL